MNRKTEPAKRRPDGAAFVISVVLAGLGALLIWDAARLPQATGYGGVGPADVPRMIGYCLLGLGAWTLVAGFRTASVDRPRQEVAPIVWIIAGLAAQLALLDVVGFSIATGILFSFAARAFGKRELWISLPIGVAFSFLVYGIFDRILQLNLPGGLLEMTIYGG